MSRITKDFKQGNNYPINLCYCKDCTFAFYDYRMSDEEINRLYYNYRDENYQKQREYYECWYTKKVNDALNFDSKNIQEQQMIIEQIISQNIHREIKIALDYGGNEGRTFTDKIGTQAKYVFDISGIPTIKGVKRIANFDDLKNYKFDFVMCNHVFEHLTQPLSMMQNFRQLAQPDTIFYIEVPSENPFTHSAGKHSLKKNISLLFNPNFNIYLLAKYYFQMKKCPPMPMKEHINFFTPESIRKMAEVSGFNVINIQENIENSALGHMTVLSMLFSL